MTVKLTGKQRHIIGAYHDAVDRAPFGMIDIIDVFQKFAKHTPVTPEEFTEALRLSAEENLREAAALDGYRQLKQQISRGQSR
jgi:hypothetical protein